MSKSLEEYVEHRVQTANLAELKEFMREQLLDYYYSVTSVFTMDTNGAYVYSDVTEQGITEEGYVDYEVSVVNSGDVSDSFEITADGAPSGWEVDPNSASSVAMQISDANASSRPAPRQCP